MRIVAWNYETLCIYDTIIPQLKIVRKKKRAESYLLMRSLRFGLISALVYGALFLLWFLDSVTRLASNVTYVLSLYQLHVTHHSFLHLIIDLLRNNYNNNLSFYVFFSILYIKISIVLDEHL